MKLLSCLRPDRQFNRKLEENRARLYRIAYSWCHDPVLADDLAQETLAKAMKNSRQLRDCGAMDTWLFRILTNLWNDHFRRNKGTLSIEDVELASETTPESEYIKSETAVKVREAVGRLPAGQRQTLTLVDLEGFSYIEVAEILDIPIGTVMSRLCRARRALKESLLVSDPAEAVEYSGRIRRVK